MLQQQIKTNCILKSIKLQVKARTGVSRILKQQKNIESNTWHSSTINQDHHCSSIQNQNNTISFPKNKRKYRPKGLLSVSCQQIKKEILHSSRNSIKLQQAIKHKNSLNIQLKERVYRQCLTECENYVQLNNKQKDRIQQDKQLQFMKQQIITEIFKDKSEICQKQNKKNQKMPKHCNLSQKQNTPHLQNSSITTQPQSSIKVQRKIVNIEQLKNEIQLWIDPISPILNHISGIMIEYKVHFRLTMFLMYKLYWLRRELVKQQIQQKNSTQRSISHLIKQINQQNQKIKQVIELMLKKLKQSKKWVNNSQNLFYSQFQVNSQNTTRLVQIVIEHTVQDFNKLKDVVNHSQQHKQALICLGCCLVVQVFNHVKPQIQSIIRKFRNINAKQMSNYQVQQLQTALKIISNFNNAPTH